MPKFEERRDDYEALWTSATLRPENAPEVGAAARRILGSRPRYDEVSRVTGVPWYVIGIIHYMECSLDFTKHLHNGDPLNAKTVRKPRGRGPFATWELSAIDALKYDKLDKVSDWSVARIAYMLETFNGFGYVPKGIPSPYLWSFTTAYNVGKWKEVQKPDGTFRSVWDSSLRSKQCGGMAILKMLITLDPQQIDIESRPVVDVMTGFAKAPLPVPPTQVGEAVKSKTVWLTATSVMLSIVGAIKAAVEAVREFFGGLFGNAVDVASEGMKALPLISADVETAMAPVRSLGTMISANLSGILHTVSLLMLVVVIARHVRDRRELKRLKALLPAPEAAA